MFETFRNAWKIEDLRKRLLFTLLILVLFRLGSAIPVPYITADALDTMFASGSMLNYLNMMSGGNLANCTIFALGVQPYINASIIVQLLCVAIPYLENLSKEGEEGRRKLTKITNYVGAGIALVLSIGYFFVIRRMGALAYTDGASLELVQVGDLDGDVLGGKDVVEAALGQTALQRHLAAFKAGLLDAGTGFLTLVAVACGLAVAGACAAALAGGRLVGALGRFQFMEFHACTSLRYSLVTTTR